MDETGITGFDPDAVHTKYLAERDKRLVAGRADIRDLRTDERFAHFRDDPFAQRTERSPVTDEPDVVILGGQVQRASGGCVGAAAVAQVQGMLFDQGFIGGCAMAPESGLTGFDYADCEFKKAVIKQCSEIIVGLTSDKIPAVARFVVAASSDIDVLVVEENISREYRVAFQQHDIRIHTV